MLTRHLRDIIFSASLPFCSAQTHSKHLANFPNQMPKPFRLVCTVFALYLCGILTKAHHTPSTNTSGYCISSWKRAEYGTIKYFWLENEFRASYKTASLKSQVVWNVFERLHSKGSVSSSHCPSCVLTFQPRSSPQHGEFHPVISKPNSRFYHSSQESNHRERTGLQLSVTLAFHAQVSAAAQKPSRS